MSITGYNPISISTSKWVNSLIIIFIYTNYKRSVLQLGKIFYLSLSLLTYLPFVEHKYLVVIVLYMYFICTEAIICFSKPTTKYRWLMPCLTSNILKTRSRALVSDYSPWTNRPGVAVAALLFEALMKLVQLQWKSTKICNLWCYLSIQINVNCFTWLMGSYDWQVLLP